MTDKYFSALENRLAFATAISTYNCVKTTDIDATGWFCKITDVPNYWINYDKKNSLYYSFGGDYLFLKNKNG